MDTLSLFYFSEVAKDLHITRTANRLFISQQTLSNHLSRLEESFGVQLLYRKPSLSLTYAGEHVLAFAEKINRENANLKDILSDIQQEDRGLILFGASTLRMAALLPDVLPLFSVRYPQVEIRISDEHSKQLEELVLRGDLDMAITLPRDENPKLTQTPLMLDQIYLCATDELLTQFYGDETALLKERAKNGLNLKDFSQLPFCILKNRLGSNIQRCFEEAGFNPHVYITSAHIQIVNSICFTGLAASFATRTSLYNLRGQIPAGINIFPLQYKGQPLIEKTSLIHHKDRYLNHYNQFFFELILNYFEKLEKLPMKQLITTGLGNCKLKINEGGD